jgi:hypothetical protein
LNASFRIWMHHSVIWMHHSVPTHERTNGSHIEQLCPLSQSLLWLCFDLQFEGFLSLALAEYT